MRKFLIAPNGNPIITHNDEPYPCGTIEIPLTDESEKIPHLQLRVAWAYGAEIEILLSPGVWKDVTSPNFSDGKQYRIKPSNPNADKIKSIREEMDKLAARLKELEK